MSMQRFITKPSIFDRFQSRDNKMSQIITYGGRYHSIQHGSLPDELRAIVVKILSALRTSKIKFKMCSFYVVEKAGNFQIWVAMSGSGDVNKMQRKLAGITGVTFIPFDARRIIDFDADEEIDELDRMDLFTRFLLKLLTNIDAPLMRKLSGDFHLNPAHMQMIKTIAAFYSSAAFDAMYNEFCYAEGFPKEEHSKIDFLITIFIRYDVIDFAQNMTPSATVSQKNTLTNVRTFFTKKGKKIKSITVEDSPHGSYEKRMREAFPDEFAACKAGLKALWEQLSKFSEFELSEKLCDCSERNLLNFLSQNSHLLKADGEHYTFNVQIGKKDSAPDLVRCCDVCQTNFPNHFKRILQRIGLDTNKTSFGVIPTRPLSPGALLVAAKATLFSSVDSDDGYPDDDMSYNIVPDSDDWYSDDQINALLPHYLNDFKDIEVLDGMMGTNWQGDGINILVENLRQYNQQRAQDIADDKVVKDKVIIPVNLGNRHWVLVCIHYSVDMARLPDVFFIDPLGHSVNEQVKSGLQEVFGFALTILDQPGLKLQNDDYNCGPWIIEIARYFAEHQALPTREQININQARQQQLHDLGFIDTANRSMLYYRAYKGIN